MDDGGESEVIRQMRLRAETRVNEARDFLRRNPLVGLTADEAGRLADEAGVAFRPVDIEQPIFSADLRPGRITAMVRNGVVFRAEVGN